MKGLKDWAALVAHTSTKQAGAGWSDFLPYFSCLKVSHWRNWHSSLNSINYQKSLREVKVFLGSSFMCDYMLIGPVSCRFCANSHGYREFISVVHMSCPDSCCASHPYLLHYYTPSFPCCSLSLGGVSQLSQLALSTLHRFLRVLWLVALKSIWTTQWIPSLGWLHS